MKEMGFFLPVHTLLSNDLVITEIYFIDKYINLFYRFNYSTNHYETWMISDLVDKIGSRQLMSDIKSPVLTEQLYRKI